MQVKITEFCGLSKNSKWKTWLKTTASDLADDLTEMQKSGASCSKNTQKMVDIYNELLKRNKKKDLFSFLEVEFPNVIMHSTTIRKRSIKSEESYQDTGEPNKHKVFEYYNPKILTFPQKRIIIDPDIESLERRVKSFVRDKVDADYIMIEDRAYIEYFLPKFKREASKYPTHMREIVKWRKDKNFN